MAGIGIAKKGLGLLGKKRKTLTVSGSTTPKKRTVIIKKPSKTKLADNWKDRRIDAMNRKIKKSRGELPRTMLKKRLIFMALKL